jgi:hypothetical protein
MIVERVAPEMIGAAGEETTIMATIMTMTMATTIRTRPVIAVGR